MFCPNCGSQNKIGLNFCRRCGLRLDEIAEAVAEQLPSQVDAATLRRKQKYERAGTRSLLLAGVVALGLLILFYSQYTNLGYFFPPALFGAVIAWITLFLLPAVILFFYGRSLKPKFLQQEDVPLPPAVTSKLIPDRPFEPVHSSVTEDTTEKLRVPRT